jgi:8-oxo-dGTP diphosphatase
VAVRVGEARARRDEGPAVSNTIRAAGGLVVRASEHDRERGAVVLVVHRPQYDDWTFPKGKLEPDETDEECAVREVEEETGLRCELGDELPSTSYVDSLGRAKSVRYWRMRVVSGELAFVREVDDARWVTLGEAAEILTYPRDLALLVAL